MPLFECPAGTYLEVAEEAEWWGMERGQARLGYSGVEKR